MSSSRPRNWAHASSSSFSRRKSSSDIDGRKGLGWPVCADACGPERTRSGDSDVAVPELGSALDDRLEKKDIASDCDERVEGSDGAPDEVESKEGGAKVVGGIGSSASSLQPSGVKPLPCDWSLASVVPLPWSSK
mmetsp:Transcript_691/g.1836  ORF Transcript_691/g.1836 Transcript_691/m.1836 type:complete len:135 (-) Transcript_691:298-702(-)